MFDDSGDTLAFYSTDDFAISVLITLAGGATVETNGIFTEPAEIFDLTDSQLTAVAPTVIVPTNEVEDVRKGDTVDVTVDETDRSFSIERVQKTGTGDTVLYLKT